MRYSKTTFHPTKKERRSGETVAPFSDANCILVIFRVPRFHRSRPFAEPLKNCCRICRIKQQFRLIRQNALSSCIFRRSIFVRFAEGLLPECDAYHFCPLFDLFQTGKYTYHFYPSQSLVNKGSAIFRACL